MAWGVTVEETEFPLGKNGTGNTVSQATDNSAPNFETLPEDDGDLPFLRLTMTIFIDSREKSKGY